MVSEELFDSLKISDGELLPLIDDFNTIQGEGYFTGTPAYFIRIGGCDSACSWCDTKISWNPEIHDLISIEEILLRVKDNNAENVVVTGGEPSLYNLGPLCKLLKNNNINTYVETAGTNHLSGDWDWICLSPKRQDPPLEELYAFVDELKVVIFNEEDLDWAEINSFKVNNKCKLFLQAEWSRHKKITPVIVDYVKQNPKWRISIQAHKYMGIP